jgi:hypothetical protein
MTGQLRLLDLRTLQIFDEDYKLFNSGPMKTMRSDRTSDVVDFEVLTVVYINACFNL